MMGFCEAWIRGEGGMFWCPFSVSIVGWIAPEIRSAGTGSMLRAAFAKKAGKKKAAKKRAGQGSWTRPCPSIDGDERPCIEVPVHRALIIRDHYPRIGRAKHVVG